MEFCLFLRKGDVIGDIQWLLSVPFYAEEGAEEGTEEGGESMG